MVCGCAARCQRRVLSRDRGRGDRQHRLLCWKRAEAERRGRQRNHLRAEPDAHRLVRLAGNMAHSSCAALVLVLVLVLMLLLLELLLLKPLQPLTEQPQLDLLATRTVAHVVELFLEQVVAHLCNSQLCFQALVVGCIVGSSRCSRCSSSCGRLGLRHGRLGLGEGCL